MANKAGTHFGQKVKCSDGYTFDSKKERDEFCDSWNSQHQCYPIATNKKEAKSLFCAGMTQDQFNEYVDAIAIFIGSLDK